VASSWWPIDIASGAAISRFYFSWSDEIISAWMIEDL